MQKILKAKWVFIPVVLIGVVIFVLLVKNRAQPDIIPLTEFAKATHVITVPEVDVIPLVKSNGTVKPSQVWRGIAEVNGKIVEMHPRLKKGAIINKGETIAKISPSDYQLAISQAQASISTNQTQLTELDVQQKNTKSLLAIENNALELSKTELERKKKMFKDKTISRADYDRENKNYLNQQKSHAILKNTLALYPVQRDRLKAELKKLDAQLEIAKLNLQRTTIKMPFTGRVAEINIERGQFVRQGEALVIADGMEKAEITVQIPINSMSQLIRSSETTVFNELHSPQIENSLKITAAVKLHLNENNVEWKGKVARISETLDLKTRTIGVIVEVDAPYKNIIPGIKPPLMKGLFVSVELRGQLQHDRLVVPRSAIYDSHVRIVSSDNRLESRKITTSLIMGGFAVVSSGLKKGEQVVVSDLVPAIDGMLLQPINDNKSLETLVASATAGAVK